MKDPRLGEIEARLSVATPGRWAHYGDLTHEVYPADANEDDEPENIASEVPRLPDAEFIAHAPTDLAYLLAELRTAREALARVEGVVDEWEDLDLAGSGSDWERVYGKQKVSVEFAVSRIRAAVAAADGGSDAHD